MLVPPPYASSNVTFGIAGLAVAMLLAWPAVFWRAASDRPKRHLEALILVVLLILWAGFATTFTVSAAPGAAQVLLPVRPPLPQMLSMMFGVILLFWSRFGTALARTPLPVLIGMQAFRLPLELTMHLAAQSGIMPHQMSLGTLETGTGYNYDILTGVSALLLGILLVFREVPRAVLWAWNIAGSALLVGIVGIAVSSTPYFAAFGPDALNTWIFFTPFIWLPMVLVPSAMLGHLLIFRVLLRTPEKMHA